LSGCHETFPREENLNPDLRLRAAPQEEPAAEAFEDDMLRWVSEHGILADGNLGSQQYEKSVLRLVS